MKPLMTVAVLTFIRLSAAEPDVPGASPSAGKVVAMEQQVRDLRKAVRDWEDRVDERRRLLDTILETKKIIHKADAPEPEESPEDQKIMERYVAADLRIIGIEMDIARLTYLEGEELIRKAAAMEVKDNPVRKLVAGDGKTRAGDSDSSGGGSPATTAEMEKALEDLLGLLQNDLHEVIKNQPDPKRAIYCNVDSRYKLEKEQLDLMRAALARLEDRNRRHGHRP